MKKYLCLGLVVAFGGCEKITEAGEELCGECPDIAEGDVSVTGMAQIDGFFNALSILKNASDGVNANFEGRITSIGTAFGVSRGEGESLTDFTANVKAAVSADFDASVEGGIEGGLRIDYVEPKCSANVSLAVEANAECTVEAGCTGGDTGSLAVACQGECSGGCDAMCEGSCVVEVKGGECSGSCEGTCELNADVDCSGTCNGTCNGTCSLQDGEGNCKGSCTGGSCEGNCEMAAGASCDGSCHGKCVPPTATAMCEGECRGGCQGSCTGSCEGSATPPELPDCDASANCSASASAQGSASLECTPPRLDIDFSWSADLSGEGNASARAEFLTKFNVFRTEMVGVLQGFAQLTVLVEGNADANVPPITDTLKASFEAMAEIDATALGEAFAEIPPARIGCVGDAFVAAVSVVEELPGELSASLEAQASFVGLLSL